MNKINPRSDHDKKNVETATRRITQFDLKFRALEEKVEACETRIALLEMYRDKFFPDALRVIGPTVKGGQ